MQSLIDNANAQFYFDAKRIFEARSNPAAPWPIANVFSLYDDLLPEIRALVDAHQPLGADPPPNLNYVNLTPHYDISSITGAPLQSIRRDGANGNSLRALAMAYKPSGLILTMHLPLGMSDAMYSFYGNCHLRISTSENVPIFLNRFHPDVSSIQITYSYSPNISLDPIVDRIREGRSFHAMFSTNNSNNHVPTIGAMPAAPLRRMMRRLVQTGVDVIQSSTDPNLQMFVRFSLANDPQRNDDDTHEYLESLCGRIQGINYQKGANESRIGKPANLNIPHRTLTLCVEGYWNKEVTLSIHTF